MDIKINTESEVEDKVEIVAIVDFGFYGFYPWRCDRSVQFIY